MRMTPPQFMHRAAVILHVALAVAVGVREGTPFGPLLILPLLAPLRGLLQGRVYTFAWASMLLGFYAAGYLAAGYARPEWRASAFGLATLAAAEYLSLILFVRLRARERRVAQGPPGRTAASGDASR